MRGGGEMVGKLFPEQGTARQDVKVAAILSYCEIKLVSI